MRFTEFKVMALQALGLPASGDVPEMTLRLLGVNLSMLEDVCPRLSILAQENADSADVASQAAAAVAAPSASATRSRSPPLSDQQQHTLTCSPHLRSHQQRSAPKHRLTAVREDSELTISC